MSCNMNEYRKGYEINFPPPKKQHGSIFTEPFVYHYNSARIRQVGIRKPRELKLIIFMRLALKFMNKYTYIIR
jgi:hypothetical protein